MAACLTAVIILGVIFIPSYEKDKNPLAFFSSLCYNEDTIYGGGNTMKRLCKEKDILPMREQMQLCDEIMKDRRRT